MAADSRSGSWSQRLIFSYTGFGFRFQHRNQISKYIVVIASAVSKFEALWKQGVLVFDHQVSELLQGRFALLL